jgi:hypothetical protein
MISTRAKALSEAQKNNVKLRPWRKPPNCHNQSFLIKKTWRLVKRCQPPKNHANSTQGDFDLDILV